MVEFKDIGIFDVNFGENVTVVRPSNLYGCTIGDDCFIGPFVEIQNNVTIGNRCRIQSHSFICSMVSVGEDAFIAHGVMFVNDLFKAGMPGQPELWRPTLIGNNVSIGSNATILPSTICDNVTIGAGAVVTRDITVPGVYRGNPTHHSPTDKSVKL